MDVLLFLTPFFLFRYKKTFVKTFVKYVKHYSLAVWCFDLSVLRRKRWRPSSFGVELERNGFQVVCRDGQKTSWFETFQCDDLLHQVRSKHRLLLQWSMHRKRHFHQNRAAINSGWPNILIYTYIRVCLVDQTLLYMRSVLIKVLLSFFL